MVTIFTTPKPFKGHSGVIQRNAIKSWAMLQPKPQIIIFGNDEGTAEIAAELGLTHIPQVECSDRGTPLISAMFRAAQQRSVHPLACFVNADIMLTNSFIQALKSVSSAETQFVMTGRRTLLDLDTLWDFTQPNWEDALLRRAKADGKLDDWVAMDYFAFPRGVYDDVPPFVVGRARWDNWMIYSARQRGIAVVDATHDLLAIHQNHDYGHLAGGLKDCFVSPEGRNNQELYGLNTCIGTADATRLLRNGHLRVPLGRASLSRRLDTLPIFNPGLARLLRPLTAVRDFAKSLRDGSKASETPQPF